MLVCPSCRSENVEDAIVCRHCGSGLDAVSSPLRGIDRSEEADVGLDLPPPRATSVWPLVITLLVAGLGVLGWGLFAALQPNPCEGRYSSALYAYCAEIPEGWAASPSFEPGGNLDRYQMLGTDATEPGSAETTVQVAQVLDPMVATPQYAQQFRTSQEANGHALGAIEGVMLDGEQAIAWDFSIQQEPEPLEVRDVVLVRGDGTWQIRFISTPEVYQEARIAFEQMLASWRWKG